MTKKQNTLGWKSLPNFHRHLFEDKNILKQEPQHRMTGFYGALIICIIQTSKPHPPDAETDFIFHG